MDVFGSLADPTRRAVLDLLAEGERSAGELGAAAPGLTQPALSRHLRVLRETGLVQVRVQGQRRVYRLDAAPLTEVDAWVDRYRSHWSTALDRLADHLAADQARADPPNEEDET